MLSAIWWVSVALALGTVLIAVALLLRRAAADRHRDERVAVAERLRRQLLAVQQPALARDLSAFPPLPAQHHPIAMEVGLDMLRAVRGEGAQRVVQMLLRWGLEGYVIRSAASGSRGERIAAVTLLSYLDSDASLTALLEQAESKSTYVRLAALRGLARRNARADLMAICRFMGEDTNTRVLADILARFSSEAAGDLCRLARAGQADEVRLAAVVALGAIAALEGTATLVELARQDPNENIRAQAVDSLAKIGDRRAEEVVLEALSDSSPGVRARAATAAGSLRVAGAITHLGKQLGDADWWARFRAAESLLNFGDRGAALLRSVAAQQGRAADIARDVLLERGLRP